MVEAKMLEDDETTATQLHQMLLENGVEDDSKMSYRTWLDFPGKLLLPVDKRCKQSKAVFSLFPLVVWEFCFLC